MHGAMPDLGILGWIIVGLIAGALAGFFVPGRERFGCLGTMLIGIVGGIVGGWLWTNVLDQDPAGGLLGAIVVAAAGAALVLLVLRAISGPRA
jgi:uncharacterized membrane protein YeaQ/YmgE (transglycosylase-associated protein family)